MQHVGPCFTRGATGGCASNCCECKHALWGNLCGGLGRRDESAADILGVLLRRRQEEEGGSHVADPLLARWAGSCMQEEEKAEKEKNMSESLCRTCEKLACACMLVSLCNGRFFCSVYRESVFLRNFDFRN